MLAKIIVKIVKVWKLYCSDIGPLARLITFSTAQSTVWETPRQQVQISSHQRIKIGLGFVRTTLPQGTANPPTSDPHEPSRLLGGHWIARLLRRLGFRNIARRIAPWLEEF